MGLFKLKSKIVEAVTFDELIQHGIDSGAQLVNGMPWSFEYKGYPVTSENDSLYFVCVNGVNISITDDEVLIIDLDGIDVIRKNYFDKKYEPVRMTESALIEALDNLVSDVDMQLSDNPDIDIPSFVNAKSVLSNILMNKTNDDGKEND